uniref:Uncharacterized protein n=6 Tax=Aegilops tauschii subsp. strangulata TaxID=200361 RepID=A0A453N200_AEGTS
MASTTGEVRRAPLRTYISPPTTVPVKHASRLQALLAGGSPRAIFAQPVLPLITGEEPPFPPPFSPISVNPIQSPPQQNKSSRPPTEESGSKKRDQ